MAEYIDRNAVMEEIQKIFHETDVNGEEQVGVMKCHRIIRTQPAADVVEVVRCKDCRFCKKHPTSDKVKMCTNEQQWVTECYPLVHDNDYCSYGERKEV